MFTNHSKSIFAFLFILTFHLNASGQWSNLNKICPNLDISDIAVNGKRVIAVGTSFTNNFIGHILISEDEGKTWDTTQLSPHGYFLKTIAFKDKDTGFIGGYGGISIFLRTTDGGKNWSWYNTDYYNTGITDMQFIDSRVGFACGYGSNQFFSGNVYKTIDGGTTWSPQADPMDSLPLDGMQMLNAQYGYAWSGSFGFRKLVRTTDSGNTWQQQYEHTTIPGGMYWWSVNEGILVDIKGGIYKTLDAGKNWNKIQSPVSASFQFNAVAFIDRKTGYIVGTSGVILKSVDMGETWVRESSPTGRLLSGIEFHGNHAYSTGFDGVILRSQYVSGLDEALRLNPFRVYPNPVVDRLYITPEYCNRRVVLYDMEGRTVLNTLLSGEETSMDVSMLQAGLYWLKADGAAPVKFLKE